MGRVAAFWLTLNGKSIKECRPIKSPLIKDNLMNHISQIYFPKKLTIVFVLIFVLSMYVFTAMAAEAGPAGRGEGSEEVHEYRVENQSYILNAGNPTIIDSVEFTISGSVKPGFASVRLEDNGAWYRCELHENGFVVLAQCDTSRNTGLKVADATNFRVVTTQ